MITDLLPPPLAPPTTPTWLGSQIVFIFSLLWLIMTKLHTSHLFMKTKHCIILPEQWTLHTIPIAVFGVQNFFIGRHTLLRDTLVLERSHHQYPYNLASPEIAACKRLRMFIRAAFPSAALLVCTIVRRMRISNHKHRHHNKSQRKSDNFSLQDI